MVYLKSALAGIAAMVAAAAIMILYLLWTVYKATISMPDNWGSYVDFHFHPWPIFSVLVLFFAAGFWCQYRRAR